ncbi:MAG: hypothetical protein ACI4IW_08355 [Oscillospiraceae bacterium]
MKRYTLEVDPAAAKFYERVGEIASMPAEKIMEEALFKLAGELAAKAVFFDGRNGL